MTKTILIPNGIMTLVESKAICPHCNTKIPFEKIEKKWQKQDEHHIKMKCQCKKIIGITTNMMGDFVAYKLNDKTIK